MKPVLARLPFLTPFCPHPPLSPPQVDTPSNTPARIRFARYRGLKSFRASPWDPYEGLPPEYARVFGFENFRATHGRALAAAAALPGVEAGAYVRLRLTGVTAEAATALGRPLQEGGCGPGGLVVAWGLLQHESKLSLLHWAVRRPAPYVGLLRGKQPLLFHAGFRVFTAAPIYSTDEAGAAKHKLERFLHPGRSVIASFYAPITYPSMPILGFAPPPAGAPPGAAPLLALTGSLRGAAPERVILKRIVLSGFPLRVHKRRATVRFMFHNAEDVRWFAPLEVWTKYGRRGRILEAVGTHGHMKCIFDGVIQQRDSVCVSLYKRVYPPWPAEGAFGLPPVVTRPGQ